MCIKPPGIWFCLFILIYLKICGHFSIPLRLTEKIFQAVREELTGWKWFLADRTYL